MPMRLNQCGGGIYLVLYYIKYNYIRYIAAGGSIHKIFPFKHQVDKGDLFH